ncbi:HET-domain-containing protein [Aspergillus pseudonomiae]|uniref:HET-domain-containing protein n=1 Tax=Aspergillus pseudonomiae TaxID=1506151 RepID=A0A5N7DRZ4_9EURO|nr:HET-domain-containing protein [Aspergillus pseudonomiae]KAE8409055.1 HET-domain-containing protein [Aspergillus pseudonomiae]
MSMRLLRTNYMPLQLQEFGEDKINKGEVKYAILSHRWGDDETSFQDLGHLEEDGKKATKGYKKIQRFLERAAKDGYDYAWIDTCCINKESSAELSEAINSMFRWYHLAGICYAYLQDVYPSKNPANVDTQLQRSEWFKRGWTLQELIAPPNLVFLSRDWTDIGNKNDRSQLISKITLIDESVLRGKTRLGDCSVAKRMSWASSRVTTRTEDTAYCLMGIFNVNMPLLYGEGRKAFIRLQEEIMKGSDDQSLFAWDASDLQGFNSTGLLALTPGFFKNSRNIVPFRSLKNSSPYSVTNKGIRLQLPLITIKGDGGKTFGREIVKQRKALLLECQEVSADHRAKPVAVMLGQLAGSDSQFIRINRGLHRYLSWAHLRFVEPSEIYARKIYQGFEEAVIEPARKFTGPDAGLSKPQRNMVLFFDDRCYNSFPKGNGSAIQTIHDLVSDAGNVQVCYYDQPTTDDNIEKRVMRAHKHDIWGSYKAWYHAVSRGNPDSARGDFSELTSIRGWTHECAVTFLGLFDSVNRAPGCNLARGTSGRQKEENLPSVVTHPGLVVRHAVAIDEQDPSLRPNLGYEAAECMHDFQEIWFLGGHAVRILLCLLAPMGF